MKSNSSKKLSIHNTAIKKYQQKFQKPDPENLIQQNINLKNLIQNHNHTISNLKIKNADLQRKIKLLEKGFEKFETNLFKTTINNEKQNSVPQQEQKNGKKTSQQSQYNNPASFSKTGMVHTEILKKKIADLTAMFTSTENELKFIKKLPTATIYEQNDIQKQHLIAQTVRLKSIITSLSQQLHQSSKNEDSQKFQNQFMRMMKEQNQKLKATVRLLENDKILLKSRQTIQNKLNSDLKKQIEGLKQKSLYKQSQLEKLNNQNKNLLFKKTTQFRQQQEKKQNQLISDLRTKISQIQNQKSKLQQANDFHCDQNLNLKEKQKILSQQMSEIQTKYEKLVKNRDDQIESLHVQLNSVKSDYLNFVNSGSLKKKKSIGLNLNKQMSSTVNGRQNPNRQSTHATLNYENGSSIKQKFNLNKQKISSFKQVYCRPVKWEDISLAMAHFHYALAQNQQLTVEVLLNNVQEQGQVRCADLISLFTEEPFRLSKGQATKLSRYIVQDASIEPNSKVLFDDNLSIPTPLARTILISALQKMKQKFSNTYADSWYAILVQTKKLLSSLKDQTENKQFITKDEFVRITDKYSRRKIKLEEYEFIVLKCFDRDNSQTEFVLSVRAVLLALNNISSHQ